MAHRYNWEIAIDDVVLIPGVSDGPEHGLSFFWRELAAFGGEDGPRRKNGTWRIEDRRLGVY
jgi:hypothetical protein